MISKVVKEFYEKFKIEPATIEEFGELYFFDTVEIDGKRYAPIDVDKLLKMEDILLRKHIQVDYCFYTGKYVCSCAIPFCNGRADTKREAFLEMMICIAGNYLDGNDTGDEEEIYKQVQQLFSNKENQEDISMTDEIVKHLKKDKDEINTEIELPISLKDFCNKFPSKDFNSIDDLLDELQKRKEEHGDYCEHRPIPKDIKNEKHS